MALHPFLSLSWGGHRLWPCWALWPGSWWRCRELFSRCYHPPRIGVLTSLCGFLSREDGPVTWQLVGLMFSLAFSHQVPHAEVAPPGSPGERAGPPVPPCAPCSVQAVREWVDGDKHNEMTWLMATVCGGTVLPTLWNLATLPILWGKYSYSPHLERRNTPERWLNCWAMAGKDSGPRPRPGLLPMPPSLPWDSVMTATAHGAPPAQVLGHIPKCLAGPPLLPEGPQGPLTPPRQHQPLGLEHRGHSARVHRPSVFKKWFASPAHEAFLSREAVVPTYYPGPLMEGPSLQDGPAWSWWEEGARSLWGHEKAHSRGWGSTAVIVSSSDGAPSPILWPRLGIGVILRACLSAPALNPNSFPHWPSSVCPGD